MDGRDGQIGQPVDSSYGGGHPQFPPDVTVPVASRFRKRAGSYLIFEVKDESVGQSDITDEIQPLLKV
jgi:hypothetical protein